MKYELLAILCYLTILLIIVVFSYRKQLSASDFMIGNRSVSYFLTALAAHASDMSSWLFMGYPAIIYVNGLISGWAAIGLVFFMFLNWQFIAPKIRQITEELNCLTFSSFFEKRFNDSSGLICVFTAIISLCFYTIYISAGLTGLGMLVELFGVNYPLGILIGALIVIPYVFIGGYLTLAWIDLFQGLFLLCVIIFVPLFILPTLGNWHTVTEVIHAQQLSLSLLPDMSSTTWLSIFFMTAGWGLGYFGQPHIVTKFMGIKNVHDIKKSKYIGMSWMILSLSAATLVGLIGIAFFKGQLQNPEQVFIEMVKQTFHPLLIGFILCAILAATINAMSSQILVLSSSLTEDLYKRIFHQDASSQRLLAVSRISIILVSLIAWMIAYAKTHTIYSLVLYAWAGLGASFGPLLILALYSKKINKYGAWAGILSGGIIAGVWPSLAPLLPGVASQIPSLLPGFTLSFISILFVSWLTRSHFAVEPDYKVEASQS